MDDSTQVLLDSLMYNARIQKTVLAKELNVSEAAVRKRLKKLEESGIIQGYKALIDYQKAGYSASITGLDTEPELLWQTIDALKEIEEVKAISLTSGDHMIVAEIVAKDMEQLESVHRSIEGLQGVSGVCPSLILRTIRMER